MADKLPLRVDAYENAPAGVILEKLVPLVNEQLRLDGSDRSYDAADLKTVLDRPGTLLFIACREETDEPLGFLFANRSWGLESGGLYLWINELFVTDSARREGAGRVLVSAAEDWTVQRKGRVLLGITGVKNRDALKFYASVGFDTGKVVWLEKRVTSGGG